MSSSTNDAVGAAGMDGTVKVMSPSLDDNKNAALVPSGELPDVMTAAQGSGYGAIDEMITVEPNVNVPRLKDLPPRKQKNFMVVRVLAVALAPGDCRVLSGITRELQGPASFPYVPGGDCCGIVVELPPPPTTAKDCGFQVGDCVACGFTEKPMGVGGEYAIVSIHNAAKVPIDDNNDDNKPVVSPAQGAAIAGAKHAVVLSENYIKNGDRVLVLGASGGMGSTVCQLAKHVHGASYVVGTASGANVQRLKDLNCCDEVIDYTKTDVFTDDKYMTNQFDVMIDFAGYAYQKLFDEAFKDTTQSTTKEAAGSSSSSSATTITPKSIIKTAEEGGSFVTTVPPIGPKFEIHSIYEAIKIFLFPTLWLALKSRTFPSYRSRLPTYSFGMSITETAEPTVKLLRYVTEGKVKPVVDPAGPFPFTTDGVRAAFKLQDSRHPFGKVVFSTVPPVE